MGNLGKSPYDDAGRLVYHLVPNIPNQWSLGSAAYPLKDIFIGGSFVITGNETITGNLTIGGFIDFSGAAGRVLSGSTSFAIRNNANSADNLLISDAGVATVRAGLTVTAGNATLTAGNLVFGAAAARVIPGATSLTFRDNANASDNLLITNAGVVTARGGFIASGGGFYGIGNFESAAAANGFRYFTAAISAAGNSQGTATAITAVHQQVNGANGTNGVILPAGTSGLVRYIINVSASTLEVYPPSGEQINGAGNNNPVTALAHSLSILTFLGSGTWYMATATAS